MFRLNQQQEIDTGAGSTLVRSNILLSTSYANIIVVNS